MKKNIKGITLVALVITIVILLILAGISILALTNTGIFQKAKDAKQKSEDATLKQNEVLDSYEEEIGKASETKEYTFAKTIEEAQSDDMLTKKVNSAITDDYGNKITVPAGFKIKKDDTTNNALTVNQGIVIADKDENEFVWVPVGTIYTSTEHTESNTKIIDLKRYKFDGTEDEFSGNYVEEDRGDTTATLKNLGNVIGKNITDFKNSVLKNGGYYIGRYEAGVIGYDENNIKTNNSNNEKSWTGYINANGQKIQLVSKTNQQVWNYVTQNKAAELSQNMYNSNKFTSDLINSYAWDTAIIFIQKCTDKINYAEQNRGENKSFLNTGKTKDNPCNIFDMASNVVELTTETFLDYGYPCVNRGGVFYDDNFCANGRGRNSIFYSSDSIGFRPILYIND